MNDPRYLVLDKILKSANQFHCFQIIFHWNGTLSFYYRKPKDALFQIWLRLALSRSSGYKSKWCKITDRVTTSRPFFKRAYRLEQLFSNNVFQTVIKKVHFGSFVVFDRRNFAEVTSRRGPCCRPRQWNFIFEQPNVICRKIQKEIQIIS